MTRPKDIPEDVWAAACQGSMGYMAAGEPEMNTALRAAFAGAIAAERERCAMISDYGTPLGSKIAAAIRGTL
ncbi:hypothetical protein N8A98_06715 [Devosia neptuniae]|uniref:Uncharacterized protein n=1 Tax=Devosia neptuniae TaxID=191302 RepID=A0ABY6CLG8_9HYPH|nr:hypothetical protein [Devosia neptuniae]UXN70873.1 hypothetical protein N8A98_06715 [Devosia neptuniae]